jgi:hypothetical protein
MKYTIKFNNKTNEKLYDKVYKTLNLVFGYALGEYALTDKDECKSYVLFSDDDAECELDRILPDVGEIFGTCLKYESDGDGDEEDEE